MKKEEKIVEKSDNVAKASVPGKRAIDSSDANHKLIKKSDIILLVVILLVAVIGVSYIMSTKEPGGKVVISIDGEVIEEFQLSDDHEYQMVTDNGNNLIVIKAGVVDITEADCPDKVCVNHVPIENVGETIICLPHKLVVEIVE